MKIFPKLAGVLVLVTVASCMKDDTDRTIFVNVTDHDFITTASYLNHNQIQLGQMAASKANLDAIKMFGQTMVAEHESAQLNLDSLADQLKIALPQTGDTVHIMFAQTLSTLAGHAFDTTYIQGQLTDHQTIIKVFEDELKNGSNPDIKNFAASLLPKIRLHYNTAMSIVK